MDTNLNKYLVFTVLNCLLYSMYVINDDHDDDDDAVLQSSSLLPLAMVMLFDFQDRKFVLYKCLPKEVEQPLQEVRNMESSLQRCVCLTYTFIYLYIEIYIIIIKYYYFSPLIILIYIVIYR